MINTDDIIKKIHTTVKSHEYAKQAHIGGGCGKTKPSPATWVSTNTAVRTPQTFCTP